MKSLKSFIVESLHTYNLTIKIVGDVEKNWMDMFKYNLNKFDPVDMSAPKTLPIQKDPYGFPNHKNQAVTILKCKFRYPATELMVRQIASLLHMDENRIRVMTTDYDESVDSELSGYENEMKNSPLLDKTELGEQPGAKEASKEYGGSYLNRIKDQTKDSKIGVEYAGEPKTKDAFDPFKPFTDDTKSGDKSPMTNITRPGKPKTGRMI